MTGTSSATTMTYSLSDQSTPSTRQSPFTPLTATFSDTNPPSAKTQLTAATRPSISEGRGERNIEQWILTQRQRKAILQHEEAASADQGALSRISIRADERPVGREEGDARSRQDSRSTESTDDGARQTMVISTVSTPDESVDPFRFVTTPMVASKGLEVGGAMERAASHNVGESKPMTRNRSGTTGPWPQSPLLLNFNIEAPKAGEVAAPSPAVESSYATPQIDGGEHSKVQDEQQEGALQGLGLGIDYPVSDVPERRSASESAKGFAPITTDLLRQASRHASDSASPHLSINMSSPNAEDERLHRDRSKSKEALLTRRSRTDQAGPSPVLPNDCRSPRTVSGKEVGSSAPGGLSAVLVEGSMPPSSVTVHRAQTANENVLVNSKSIASSISAFVYNATPAPTNAVEQHLDLPNKGKTGSIGWRKTSRIRGRDSVLGLGMRNHAGHDSDVKFVNIDLDDGGLETEVTIDSGEASNSRESTKGQWVSKLWNAVSSPRQTSFNFSDKGDRSLDLEQQPAAKGDRTVSRGSFRPLSLVEKRQSSGRYNLDLQRQRFRSPTPGEEDEIAEKDARAVALRLLAGSPRLPPPAEGVELEVQQEQSTDRADLSAEEREKERINALKKLRRMSAVGRQRKRNSGIGYITSSTPVVEGSRLPYVQDSQDQTRQQGGLERAGSIKTNKRVSVTLFGGKERYSVLSPLAANEPELAPERAWLDSMRSPRLADSPSGFTPRMAFEPHDWGAAQQEQQECAPRPANHIPLLLSSGGATAQRPAVAAVSANDHGMTVSELDRARDEMRRLAGQGMAYRDDEEEAHETYHTPLPDAPDSWSYADQHHYPPAPVEYEPATTTALGDFGISPEKDTTTTRLHRRTNTRTARFAVDEPDYDDAEDHPAVSIFTRQKHRRQHSFSNVQHSPLTGRRSRRHGGGGGGHGLFATPAALLDSNTPSKNMFWAGFLGMPWLWMIGGWYLTPDGQLRHPSADGKVDVWQHEPSMQNSSPIPGSSSTFAEGWMQGESGLGLGLTGIPAAMSYTPSSTGTTNSTQTTSSDPNRPPPSKTRKSKTKSLGALLNSNPQISFYQSPVRVLQEPAPAFGGVWRHKLPMEPLPELEEPPRRHTSSIGGVQLALATKTSLGSPWRDLERYVLLNRLAAILSGVLVFAGFTTAIWAVVTNF